MTEAERTRPAILMMAYTYYESDPRVIREAEAAVAGGYSVDFLALRRPGGPAAQNLRGVNVIHLEQARYRGSGRFSYLVTYGEFFVRCFWKTHTLLLRRRYRIIHVNNMPDFLVFSTIFAKLCGAKIILDIHDPMPTVFAAKFHGESQGLLSRLLLWQERLSAWYADRVLTVHDPVKDGVLVKHGIPAAAIDVVANFPDTRLFTCRTDYDLGSQIRLAFHGTIVERAGLRNLVTAIAGLKERKRIFLRIIGDGDFAEGLKELIREHGLQETIDFDNNAYPVHQIPGLIADCNVGVVPLEISSHTNFAVPVKMLEYVAMGLPVITVRSTAICYYFGENDCLFYQWDDVSSLQQLLEGLIGAPETLLRYRERSVALRERFCWESQERKYVAILRELASNATPVASPVSAE